MADNPFQAWLELQLELQVEAFHADPRFLSDSPEDRAQFVLWNAFAATDEIHEAMQEIGWKPWASSRHLNSEEFLGELVDALHFIGNMILAAAVNQHETPETLARILWSKYQDKVQINIDRQLVGYDGVKNKCPICRRELAKGACFIHGDVDASL